MGRRAEVGEIREWARGPVQNQGPGVWRAVPREDVARLREEHANNRGDTTPRFDRNATIITQHRVGARVVEVIRVPAGSAYKQEAAIITDHRLGMEYLVSRSNPMEGGRGGTAFTISERPIAAQVDPDLARTGVGGEWNFVANSVAGRITSNLLSEEQTRYSDILDAGRRAVSSARADRIAVRDPAIARRNEVAARVAEDAIRTRTERAAAAAAAVSELLQANGAGANPAAQTVPFVTIGNPTEATPFYRQAHYVGVNGSEVTARSYLTPDGGRVIACFENSSGSFHWRIAQDASGRVGGIPVTGLASNAHQRAVMQLTTQNLPPGPIPGAGERAERERAMAAEVAERGRLATEALLRQAEERRAREAVELLAREERRRIQQETAIREEAALRGDLDAFSDQIFGPTLPGERALGAQTSGVGGLRGQAERLDAEEAKVKAREAELAKINPVTGLTHRVEMIKRWQPENDQELTKWHDERAKAEVALRKRQQARGPLAFPQDSINIDGIDSKHMTSAQLDAFRHSASQAMGGRIPASQITPEVVAAMSGLTGADVSIRLYGSGMSISSTKYGPERPRDPSEYGFGPTKRDVWATQTRDITPNDVHNSIFQVTPEPTKDSELAAYGEVHNSFQHYPPKGFGSEVFARQVRTVANLGYPQISVGTAGNFERSFEPSGWNGYYTWAAFGYDSPLSPEHTNETGALRLKDLMRSPEGREYWMKNGTNFHNGVFDLRPGSSSMKTLESYLAETHSPAARIMQGVGPDHPVSKPGGKAGTPLIQRHRTEKRSGGMRQAHARRLAYERAKSQVTQTTAFQQFADVRREAREKAAAEARAAAAAAAGGGQ